MHRDSLHSSVVGRNLLQTGSSADVVLLPLQASLAPQARQAPRVGAWADST